MYVHVLIPGTYEGDFILGQCFCGCNYVKDFEMRSFWITQLGPKSDEKCLNKRKTEGDLRQRREEDTDTQKR